MKLYSTNNKRNIVSLKEAVLKSLAIDKGLYMPVNIPKLDSAFLDNLNKFSFEEIAFHVSANLFGDLIPPSELWHIVSTSINFPAPVVELSSNISILELFHGPSLAFKDFGARYMAQLMAYFNQTSDDKLTILVATSGDTGGAVAAGFLDTIGIEVIILYPSGRVSDLQEKQLTTLGKNIFACEIEGSFDDCQAMVKEAFLDPDLQKKYNLSSANSINIARLIPQSFYYFEAYKQLPQHNKEITFCIPSGNFGNLTAGLLAKKMGLDIHRFIAATNLNKVVPEYLSLGNYNPKESISTISNAMDVGAPSNFTRIMSLYDSDWKSVKKDIAGYFFSDDETKQAMKEIHKKYNYVADPHGAVGYLASQSYLKENPDQHVCFLETAHPSKFLEIVESTLNKKLIVPERLSRLSKEKKIASLLPRNYDKFKEYLLDR